MKAKEARSTKDRRSLVAGINAPGTVDPAVEEHFVFAGKPKATKPVEPQPPAAEAKEGKGQPANAASRMPLTTRIRTDFAIALKRASLERQLSGTVPNTLQDILEEALEPWLRLNGYLN
jgi:hypothetical protein